MRAYSTYRRRLYVNRTKYIRKSIPCLILLMDILATRLLAVHRYFLGISSSFFLGNKNVFLVFNRISMLKNYLRYTSVNISRKKIIIWNGVTKPFIRIPTGSKKLNEKKRITSVVLYLESKKKQGPLLFQTIALEMYGISAQDRSRAYGSVFGQ